MARLGDTIPFASKSHLVLRFDLAVSTVFHLRIVPEVPSGKRQITDPSKARRLGGGEAYASDAEVTRERDRLCLVYVAGASMIARLGAERDARLRVGFRWDCRPATAEGDGVGVTAEPISEVTLRPRPSALAVLERCSE